MAIERLLALLMIAFCAAACAACAGNRIGVPVNPPTGGLFAYHAAPLDTNFDATPVGTKEGEAILHFLHDPIITGLPILTWGDADLAEAMSEGRLTKAHYSDYHILSVLGIYVQITVKVSGD